jgi:hypothetical protein
VLGAADVARNLRAPKVYLSIRRSSPSSRSRCRTAEVSFPKPQQTKNSALPDTASAWRLRAKANKRTNKQTNKPVFQPLAECAAAAQAHRH